MFKSIMQDKLETIILETTFKSNIGLKSTYFTMLFVSSCEVRMETINLYKYFSWRLSACL